VGAAAPADVRRVLSALRAAGIGPEVLALHLHDTRGTALANVLAALDAGVASVDSSAGGLGGCPFAPGAAGNLATEDLLYMLHGMQIHTGVDLGAVATASLTLAGRLGRELPSRCLQALRAARAL
jgi:hydroxymethylglutaryl-CoA lyase